MAATARRVVKGGAAAKRRPARRGRRRRGVDRSKRGGDGILKLDNSDPDAASELPPWHRGWICGARAGVGLRNGGWKGPRGHIERFGGKLACLLKYVIVQKWVLLSPRMP